MRQLLLNIMLPKCVIVSTVAKYYKFDINVKLYFYKRVEIKELHSVESVCSLHERHEWTRKTNPKVKAAH